MRVRHYLRRLGKAIDVANSGTIPLSSAWRFSLSSSLNQTRMNDTGLRAGVDMAWIGAPYKDHNQLALFTCSQALVGADQGLAGDLLYWYTCVSEKYLEGTGRGHLMHRKSRVVCVGTET